MDKTKIVYFIFPFHIDLLERTIYQLKRAANYSDTKKYLSLDIVFNMADDKLDWDNCKLPKEFFVDKFRYIEKHCDFCKEVNFEINDDIKGSGEHQRRILNNNNGEYNLIWLDPDIYFPVEILHVLENIIPTIEKETLTYMITPQIAKFWDASWNVISSEEYVNSPVSFDDINVFELETKINLQEISLLKNYDTKFAGGWFNFHSKELTKLMKLPESIGDFRHIDLFQQEKFKMMNASGKYNIPQYIIKNCIIQEDRKYWHAHQFWTKYITFKAQSKTNDVFAKVSEELHNIKNSLMS
jgi:phage FluMu protein Com